MGLSYNSNLDLLLCSTSSRTVAVRLDYSTMEVLGLFDLAQCPSMEQHGSPTNWSSCEEYPGLLLGTTQGKECWALVWRDSKLECQKFPWENTMDSSLAVDAAGLVHAIILLTDGSIRCQTLRESRARRAFVSYFS